MFGATQADATVGDRFRRTFWPSKADFEKAQDELRLKCQNKDEVILKAKSKRNDSASGVLVMALFGAKIIRNYDDSFSDKFCLVGTLFLIVSTARDTFYWNKFVKKEK